MTQWGGLSTPCFEDTVALRRRRPKVKDGDQPTGG
jgi:hypothetical protein